MFRRGDGEASFRGEASVGKALDSQHSRTHHRLFARTASERKHLRLNHENTNQQKPGGWRHSPSQLLRWSQPIW